MFSYVEEFGVLLYAAVVLLCFLPMHLCSRALVFHWADTLGFINIGNALALGLLICFHSLGLLADSELYRIAALYVAFYAGMYAASAFQRAGALRDHAVLHLRSAIRPTAFTTNMVMYCGLGLIALNVFFAIMLGQVGESGDDRVLVAHAWRPLAVIRDGLAALFPYLAIAVLLLTRSPIISSLIAAVVGVTFLSGSKSFLLSYALAYLTLRHLRGSRRTIKTLLIEASVLVAVLLGGVGVRMYWGDGLSDAFFAIFDRILASGDIYYYSHVAGDYRNLCGHYDFAGYVLHPFTSIIGQRGYELPLGAELFGNVSGDYSGYGTNSQLPILGLVLLNGSRVLPLLLLAGVGAFIATARCLTFQYLNAPSIPAALKMCWFTVLYVFPPFIFLDIGIYEHAMIGMSMVLLLTQAGVWLHRLGGQKT